MNGPQVGVHEPGGHSRRGHGGRRVPFRAPRVLGDHRCSVLLAGRGLFNLLPSSGGPDPLTAAQVGKAGSKSHQLREQEAPGLLGLQRIQGQHLAQQRGLSPEPGQEGPKAPSLDSNSWTSPQRRAGSGKSTSWTPRMRSSPRSRSTRTRLDWAGVEGELAAALQEATGGVQRIREVPLITRAMWNQMTQDLRVPEDPDPAVMGPPNTRPLCPVEHARLESLRRVLSLRMGRTPDDPGSPSPVAPVAGTTPFPTVGGVGTTDRAAGGNHQEAEAQRNPGPHAGCRGGPVDSGRAGDPLPELQGPLR